MKRIQLPIADQIRLMEEVRRIYLEGKCNGLCYCFDGAGITLDIEFNTSREKMVPGFSFSHMRGLRRKDLSLPRVDGNSWYYWWCDTKDRSIRLRYLDAFIEELKSKQK